MFSRTTAPVISFGDENIVYSDRMETSDLLEGVYAYDKQDGDVSSSLLIEKVSKTADGQVIVTYAARDDSNNVSKSSRIIRTKMRLRMKMYFTIQKQGRFHKRKQSWKSKPRTKPLL